MNGKRLISVSFSSSCEKRRHIMSTNRKPNVIVFFTDQQRWDTTGVHGNHLDVTPNFDRMAMEGTHIYHSFTCQPVCGRPDLACKRAYMLPKQAALSTIFRSQESKRHWRIIFASPVIKPGTSASGIWPIRSRYRKTSGAGTTFGWPQTNLNSLRMLTIR